MSYIRINPLGSHKWNKSNIEHITKMNNLLKKYK